MSEQLKGIIGEELNGLLGSKENLFPIQIAGQDEIMREYTFNSQLNDQDVRMYLDIPTLEKLLEVARQSRLGKVILHGAGIKVSVRRSRDGHIYSVLGITSYGPRPVRAPTNFSMDIETDVARNLHNRFGKN
jgi:hypothetical protein